jgi:hypothetical protein
MKHEPAQAHDKVTKQLVNDIVRDYFNARKIVVPSDRISRGISRVISSFTEERIAYWCIQKFGEQIHHIYVDQDLWNGPEHLARPDLVVLGKSAKGQEPTIRLMVDVKMDLGHCRDTIAGKDGNTNYGLVGSAKSLLETLKNPRFDGVQISTTGKNGKKTRSDQKIRVSKNCVYVFLVVSGLNIGRDRKSLAEERFSSCVGNSGLVHLVTMFPHTHPNDRTYASEADATTHLLDDLRLGNFDQFEKLLTRALN